jgi:outer membrane lipoprotein
MMVHTPLHRIAAVRFRSAAERSGAWVGKVARNPPSRAVLAWLAATLLAGCASEVPRAIREAPADAVTVTQVRADPARYQGRVVRWGGTIIAVNNLPDSTTVEVLDRPLDWEGRPHAGEEGRGRFIARVTGFLDPAQYQKDRALTVAGPLVGTETRAVGDYPYAYPVVSVATRWLWPEDPPPAAWYPYGYPGGYGPWFDPWGPGWWGPGGWGAAPPPRRYHGPGPDPGVGPGPGPRLAPWQRLGRIRR